jgi:hypothetical protein
MILQLICSSATKYPENPLISWPLAPIRIYLVAVMEPFANTIKQS